MREGFRLESLPEEVTKDYELSERFIYKHSTQEARLCSPLFMRLYLRHSKRAREYGLLRKSRSRRMLQGNFGAVSIA